MKRVKVFLCIKSYNKCNYCYNIRLLIIETLSFIRNKFLDFMNILYISLAVIKLSQYDKMYQLLNLQGLLTVLLNLMCNMIQKLKYINSELKRNFIFILKSE